MRRFCLMAVCSVGMLLVGTAESQAFCCLFGGLFNSCCYTPSPCCYTPPPCCPSPCASGACGYRGVSYYAPAYYPSSCCGYGCSGCGTCCPSGCASGSCGSGCAGGNCGVTAQPAPTATVYAPSPFLQARFAPVVRQPAAVAAPRVTTIQSRKPVSIDRRQSQANSQWRPVIVVR